MRPHHWGGQDVGNGFHFVISRICYKGWYNYFICYRKWEYGSYLVFRRS